MKTEHHMLVRDVWGLVVFVKYLDLSELGSLLLIHFRHLGLDIRIISDGIGVALIIVRARAPVFIITVLLVSSDWKTII